VLSHQPLRGQLLEDPRATTKQHLVALAQAQHVLHFIYCTVIQLAQARLRLCMLYLQLLQFPACYIRWTPKTGIR
jgi:hypothetical protein